MSAKPTRADTPQSAPMAAPALAPWDKGFLELNVESDCGPGLDPD
jgi:hypothetical protein